MMEATATCRAANHFMPTILPEGRKTAAFLLAEALGKSPMDMHSRPEFPFHSSISEDQMKRKRVLDGTDIDQLSSNKSHRLMEFPSKDILSSTFHRNSTSISMMPRIDSNDSLKNDPFYRTVTSVEGDAIQANREVILPVLNAVSTAHHTIQPQMQLLKSTVLDCPMEERAGNPLSFSSLTLPLPTHCHPQDTTPSPKEFLLPTGNPNAHYNPLNALRRFSAELQPVPTLCRVVTQEERSQADMSVQPTPMDTQDTKVIKVTPLQQSTLVTSARLENNPNNRFCLQEQPQEIQRKSYSKENRCLLPNPLAICVKNQCPDADKITSGWVEVKLVDSCGNEFPAHRQNMLQAVHGSLRSELKSRRATFSLKAVETSEGMPCCLLFNVRYTMEGVGECEEKIISRPFTIKSKKRKDLSRLFMKPSPSKVATPLFSTSDIMPADKREVDTVVVKTVSLL